jgi:rhodanese-related sulfurtransferase
MSTDQFVAMITTGQPPVPAYFVEDAGLNRSLHDLFTDHSLVELDGDYAMSAAREDGVMVLDTRDVEAFVMGHIPGALNVPLNGRFAETAGMFIDYHGGSIALVSDAGTEHDAMRRLARVGFDNVIGFVPEFTIVALHAAGRLERGSRIDADEYDAQRRDDSVVLLDVRGPGEYADGAMEGTVNVPLPELAARIDELDRGSRFVVNCAGGWRSGVATSYLTANGFDASDVRGGYSALSKVSAA